MPEMKVSTDAMRASRLFSVKNYVCLVTGGGTGIGLMASQALAANGAKVYITGRRWEVLENAAKTHSPSDEGQIIPIGPCDVTKKIDLEKLFDDLSKKEKYLNLLITNAGISGPKASPDTAHASSLKSKLWESETFEAWADVWNTNVSSVYFTTVAFLPLLQAGSDSHGCLSASVIVISSMSGIMRESQGHFSYNAAKGATIQLSRLMSKEFEKARVRVNSIAPGYFPSEMTMGESDEGNKTHLPDENVKSKGHVPAERGGSDEEMAQAVLFLTKNMYVNGEIIAELEFHEYPKATPPKPANNKTMSTNIISAMPPTSSNLRVSLLPTYRTLLTQFISHPSQNFQILTTISPSSPPPRTLYILDSSFNPPTLAHLHMALSALRDDTQGKNPKRLLLLLAIQNADKAAQPAAFEERVGMMGVFGKDLRNLLIREARSKGKANTKEENIDDKGVPAIDIGLTKFPFFHDKARAIEESGIYAPNTEQVHLTGYDTLIRLLDPKYYSPELKLRALDSFLERHRVRVTLRTGDKWGIREEQEEFLRRLGRGELEGVGGRKEWVKRIEVVEGAEVGEGVSSTKVREACRKGDEEALKRSVTEGVREWLIEGKLY
ncbi:MAG: hypothetical protein M1834_002055 [Cirrosporium novae-zelandiae]|nr:MAG: hypothetical protein M1834_002055 [Cirrosporium novae-zelandiae]